MSRREFLSTSSLFAGSMRRSERVRVGIWVTGRSGAAEPLNALARRIKKVLQPHIDKKLIVGPEGAVQVPDEALEGDIQSAATWWESNSDGNFDANVLAFDNPSWTSAHYGWWTGNDHAVFKGASMMGTPRWQRLGVHEVGHCLGLDHHHGGIVREDGTDKASLMADLGDYPDYDWSFRMTGLSRRKLRQKV